MSSNLKHRVKLLSDIIIDIYYKKQNKVKVYDTERTLKIIRDRKKSISRFGDGEFNLMLGTNIPFQKSTHEIATELKKILYNQDKSNDCLVAIPHSYSSFNGLTCRSKYFWLKYMAQNRSRIVGLLNKEYHYWDAQITRIYVNRSDKEKSIVFFEMWKKIWQNQNVLIVEGQYSRFGVGNDLLNTAKSVRRILCPSKDAFESYQNIYDKICSVENVDLVVLVLGPTASILAYNLSMTGKWALDCGNMDMEYEWMKRGSKKQVAIEDKFTIEATDGENMSELNDFVYKDQIIARIGI